MSIVNVTNLAQASVGKKINPQYQTGLFYIQFGVRFDLPPSDFVDDTTAQLMAELLNGQVVKLKPRVVWNFGQVNNTPLSNLPLQNFIAFPGQNGAPSSNDLLVVNGGDLAQACTQGVYFMPQELYTEQAISYLIPGSQMSPEATAYTSPVQSWPVQPIYWYTPGT